MTGVTKRRVNWTKIEESIASIGFGMLLIYLAPLNFLIDIVGGILIVPGAGFLLAQPEVRVALKVIVNRVSRKQVFKNTGSISGSNVVGPVDTGGGPLTIHQGLSTIKTPYLRVIPKLSNFSVANLLTGAILSSYTLYLEVTNIGDGPATDISGNMVLLGSERFRLPNDGKFELHPLGPNETRNVPIASSLDETVLKMPYDLTVQYRGTSTAVFQSAGKRGQIKDLLPNA